MLSVIFKQLQQPIWDKSGMLRYAQQSIHRRISRPQYSSKRRFWNAQFFGKLSLGFVGPLLQLAQEFRQIMFFSHNIPLLSFKDKGISALLADEI